MNVRASLRGDRVEPLDACEVKREGGPGLDDALVAQGEQEGRGARGLADDAGAHMQAGRAPARQGAQDVLERHNSAARRGDDDLDISVEIRVDGGVDGVDQVDRGRPGQLFGERDDYMVVVV